MSFSDLGRMELEAVITDRLGERVVAVDVPALVNAYVERFGFVDLDEVNEAEFAELARQYEYL